MKYLISSLSLVLAIATSLADEGFIGWQGLRVIKSEYGTQSISPITIADSEDNARQSIMLVKNRQSRIDIYSYQGTPDAIQQEKNLENPNYLPMAEDFTKTEIPLTRLPYAATAFDVDQDGIDEIFLIQGAPLKFILLKQKNDVWEETHEWEIANHNLTTFQPILVRRLGKDIQMLISFDNGIQIVDFDQKSGIEWLQPREKSIKRTRWWLADLDEDGDQDLVETVNSVSMPLRWYEAEGKVFRPALGLSDDISKSKASRLARSTGVPKILTLGVIQQNSISAYTLGQSETTPYGKKSLLPLSQLGRDKWTALKIGKTKSIVELGREKPVLNLYQEIDGFWQFQKEFPSLKEAQQIIAVRGKANSILMRIKNDERIFHSTWESGRFTFPKPLDGQQTDAKKVALLGFGQYGDDTWWLRQEDDTINLHIVSANSKANAQRIIEFPSIKGEYEAGAWLGGEGLLLKKKFSKGTQRCILADGVSTMLDSSMSVSDMARIQIHNDTLYINTDGVVQILDEDLEINDQIMLKDEHSITSFSPISEKQAYALEQDGRHLHLMEQDKTGIYRSDQRIEIPYTLGIHHNPVLGLVLIDSNYINLPQKGSSPELVLDSHIDPNLNASRVFERKNIGNIFAVDVDGNGIDEAAAVDYRNHTVTIYQQNDNTFTEMISWKVFDDEKYPYGEQSSNVNTNPYQMFALDFDGDQKQDLVLASHDRLVIYLAEEKL